MLKKLNGLVLATLLVANAPVMAASNEDAALAQVAAQVEALVEEGKKAGLSQEETVAIVSQAIETNVLPGIASLTAKQKKYVRYALYAFGTGVVVVGGYYLWTHRTSSAETTAPAAEEKNPKAEGAQAVAALAALAPEAAKAALERTNRAAARGTTKKAEAPKTRKGRKSKAAEAK